MAFRLEVQLLGKTVRTTGDILLRAELDLLIQTTARTWEQVVFLVDSGTEMTTMPATQARLLDIPLPVNPVPGLTHAQTGLEVRAGVIRVQVVGMDGTEYVFPCYFLGTRTHGRHGPRRPPAISWGLRAWWTRSGCRSTARRRLPRPTGTW